jgi:hypothetical protein
VEDNQPAAVRSTFVTLLMLLSQRFAMRGAWQRDHVLAHCWMDECLANTSPVDMDSP